jgi:hypothetical protein
MTVRTIAILAFSLISTGCVTARQVVRVYSDPPGAAIRVDCDGVARSSGRTPGVVALSRRSLECAVTLSRPGYETQTLRFERFGAPVNPQTIKSGLLIGGLSAVGTALSGGTSSQRAQALGSGLVLAGLFLLGDEATGARYHFEPDLVNVRLDRKP